MKPYFFAIIILAVYTAGSILNLANAEPTQIVPAATSERRCGNSENLSRANRNLLGAWKHIELIRVIDGNRLSPQSIPGENIAHFYCDGTWDLIGPNFRSAGTFRWVSDDAIEQRVIESNLAIQIGMLATKRIIVDESHLEIQVQQTSEQRAQVMPPPKVGVRQAITTLVITRFERAEK